MGARPGYAKSASGGVQEHVPDVGKEDPLQDSASAAAAERLRR